MATVQLPLRGKYGEGKFTTVSAEDAQVLRQKKLYLNKNGYVTLSWNGKTKSITHVIMWPPAGMEVDHRDFDKLNNTRGNLLVCTHSQNCYNRRIERQGRYKGVTYNKSTKLYDARVCKDGRNTNLGSFSDKHEAARVYNDKLLEYAGPEFARLNVIQQEPPVCE